MSFSFPWRAQFPCWFPTAPPRLTPSRVKTILGSSCCFSLGDQGDHPPSSLSPVTQRSLSASPQQQTAVTSNPREKDTRGQVTPFNPSLPQQGLCSLERQSCSGRSTRASSTSGSQTQLSWGLAVPSLLLPGDHGHPHSSGTGCYPCLATQPWSVYTSSEHLPKDLSWSQHPLPGQCESCSSSGYSGRSQVVHIRARKRS